MIEKTCKNCAGKLYVYTRCFDCHQVIQKICYRCQWETEIVEHPNCHKDIDISISKPTIPKHSWQSTIDRWSIEGNEFLFNAIQKFVTWT
jgi:hypothetical protein